LICVAVVITIGAVAMVSLRSETRSVNWNRFASTNTMRLVLRMGLNGRHCTGEAICDYNPY
jgi:hypothetical protein